MARTLQPPAYYLPDEFGSLRVQCWCGAHFVNVPVEEVRQGRTASCNRSWCHPPKEKPQ